MAKTPARHTFSSLTIFAFFALFFTITFLTGAEGRTLKAPSDSSAMWDVPKWKSLQKSDQVWTSIRDRKIDASRPLTLDELLDIALSNNPGTRKAWEDARAAVENMKQAEGSLYPTLIGTADWTRQKKVGSPAADNTNTMDYGGGAEAAYLLFDFGGRAATIESAFQLGLEANFQFNQTFLDMVLDTENAYYGLYSAQSQREAAEADLRDAQKAYEAARQKFEVGLVSKLDALQAESNYDNALYSLEEAKGNVRSAHGSLAKILGVSADTSFEITRPDIDEVPKEVTEENVSALIEKALEKRPDVAASRASLRAKKAAVKSAFSDIWPTLNVGGTTERKQDRYYDPGKASKRYYDYSGYLKVEWDIFDGFANYAKKRKAQAQAEAERAKLMDAELEASRDVWTKYYNYKTAVQKLKFSRAFLNSAQASYDLAMNGYETGLKSILDLLEGQSQLSEARSKLVKSEKDYFISIAELVHATGAVPIKGRDFTEAPGKKK